MSKLITFNELRQIKASLPEGSMHRIADELGLHLGTVKSRIHFSRQKLMEKIKK